jgi:hypothetical protein
MVCSVTRDAKLIEANEAKTVKDTIVVDTVGLDLIPVI